MNKRIILSCVTVALLAIIILLSNIIDMKNKPISNVDQARVLVEQQFLLDSPQNKMVITDVKEGSDGWIFTYVPENYLQSKNPNDLIPGNFPYYVHKDGSISNILPNGNIFGKESTVSSQ